MNGMLRRLAVVVLIFPAILAEWARWVATGSGGDYVMRLMRWAGISV